MVTRRSEIQRRQVKYLLISLGLFVVVLISARATYNMYIKAQETGERRYSVEAAVAELENREESLKKEVELIQTPRGLDKEIRERYAVKKPGEGVIVIIDDEEEVEEVIVEDENTSHWFWKLFGR